MNLESIFEKFNKNKKEQKTAPVHQVELEKFPFEREFDQFLVFSKTLEADEDMVDGKLREYVSTTQLIPAYQQAFGDAALVVTTLRHRIIQIKPEDFPEDFIVLNESARGESKYYVNRLNKKLLKKIFLPDVGSEMRDLIDEVHLRESDLSIVRDGESLEGEPLFSSKVKNHPEDEELHYSEDHFSDSDK